MTLARRLAALLMLLPLAARADPRWPDYQVIMWQAQSADAYRALHALGIGAGTVMALRTPRIDPAAVAAQTRPLLASSTRYYVENVATDFYAPYHRWTPEHPTQPNWLMDQVRRRHWADPADPSVWERQPSLSDEAWIDRIRDRLAQTVSLHAPNRPLFYDLGDETGIADLASAWDFDRSAPSLAAFRIWLRTRYPSLATLNAQWGSSFAAWDAVVPEHTTAAMARTDGNFAAWSDFQDFMDSAFARALRAGTQAVHRADPTALAAIAGAQAPGRGGYDYTRLPHAVDVMEISAGPAARQIARAVNPGLIELSTSFGSGPEEVASIWHDALAGAGGRVIWNDPPMLDAAGKPTARAQALAPVLRELSGGLGTQLLAAGPRFDPVAVLYSPTSQRVQWLLDHRAAADGWTHRSSGIESGADDTYRRSLDGVLGALRGLGVQPHVLDAAQLANGALSARGIRLLVLPRALALPHGAMEALRGFLAAGGTVAADVPPGSFDGHGTLIRGRALPRLRPIAGDTAGMRALLAAAGVEPVAKLTEPDGTPADGITISSLIDGRTVLLGLQADYRPGALPRRVVVHLPASMAVQNMRGGGATQTDTLPVTLDPVVPTLLALSPTRLPHPVVAVVRPGRRARIALSLSGPSPAAVQVARVDILRPDGTLSSSASVPLGANPVTPEIDFEPNDPHGNWTVRVQDMLGSGIAETKLFVGPP